ncbi:MAG: NUDIX hydrolase, partial [Actinomycetia bacterium]|nr:NUDIX hydrolase [Actinomycetes bacterium]
MPTDLLAAGAVALRGEGADREVLVVHRPAYDDWTLPKGKPDGGELLPVAAVREFAEETGYVPDGLSQPLGVVSYTVGAATKQVSWWLARLAAAATAGPVANPAEVDEVRWLPLPGVRSRLTYADEADLVERAAAAGRPSVPFVVVRHAKAMDRFEWPAGVPDVKRPLAPRGARQAEALAGLLGAYGVRRVASSAAV